MRYEYIEPFVVSTMKVLDSVISSDIAKGNISLVKGDEINGDVTIVISLGGDTEGNILLSMDMDTAVKLCSTMTGGAESCGLTPLGLDSISELANMIAGNATTVLNDMGYDFTLSPPIVIRKEEIKDKAIPDEAFQIPLFTEFGEITMNVILRTN